MQHQSCELRAYLELLGDQRLDSCRCDESKLKVLGRNVLGMEVVESFNCVAEGAGVTDMIPGKGFEADCEEFLC